MQVWAIANQKGGVGKSTTAVALGGLLAEQGRRCLLVDMDPHGSLTSYFRLSADDLQTNLFTLFHRVAAGREPEPCDALHETGAERLLLLPGAAALATLDREFGRMPGMGLAVSRVLAGLDAHFDHVLLDCPPVLGLSMVNAVAACDGLIIPVQTEFLALKGLERMMQTWEMIGRSLNKTVPYVIVPTLFDRRTRAGVDALSALKRGYAGQLSPVVIPEDTLFRDASRAGQTPSRFAPRSRGVEAYRQLLAHVSRCFAAVPARAAG